MGALSGVAQAAGVMIGKRLGADDKGSASQDSKRLMYTGFACSVLMSALVIVFNKYYVLIFPVEEEVRQITRYLPIAAVYVILSMEECIRVIISLVIFRNKKWMQKL
jgi:Na+-driven multidrug efflux pump